LIFAQAGIEKCPLFVLFQWRMLAAHVFFWGCIAEICEISIKFAPVIAVFYAAIALQLVV
jgi:hypothetical protein